MGSGGPRGLQIPRSDVHRARGGFDSHTLPPLVAAALCAVLLSVPATGRASAVDSLSSTPEAPPRWSDQPRFVMMRSLLVPGWGQFHNHAYVKSAAVAAGEVWILSALSSSGRRLDQLQSDYSGAGTPADSLRLKTAYDDENAHYVSLQWLLGGMVAYAMLDAYVDAHFRNFQVEFRKQPPPPGDRSPGKVVLNLRWNF